MVTLQVSRQWTMIPKKILWDVSFIQSSCRVPEWELISDRISIMVIPGLNIIHLFPTKMESWTAQHTRQVIIFQNNGGVLKCRFLQISWAECPSKVSMYKG